MDNAESNRRRIKLFTYWQGSVGDVEDGERYDDAQVKRDVGDEYRLVIWHEAGTDMGKVSVNVVSDGTNDSRVRVVKDAGKNASMVWVPTEKNVTAEVEVAYG